MKRHSGKNITAAAALVTMLILSSCQGTAGSGSAAGTSGAAAETSGAAASAKKELTTEAIEGLPMVDMSKWQYNAEDDVYWQVGIPYCASPADETYETMGFFVPGAYFLRARITETVPGPVKKRTTRSAEDTSPTRLL